ncbi:MAG: DNA-processing protein DprA [Candidatus Omnitrophica bacterium]|nr:DNA-processing protein DprA [Candidatus Omnitrophota bacterium]
MLTKTQCNVIALSMISGIGPRKLLALSGKSRNFEDIFSLSTMELSELVGGRVDVDPETVRKSREYLEELSYIEEAGITAITYWDEDYPAALRDIHTPPPVLYCKGSFHAGDACSVAIVGSRRCSAYGIQMAEKLAFGLAERGITVVSGMARGIDQAAAKGALMAGGRTIAVMGSGFRHMYPKGSERLARDISANGVVTTEYDSRTEPLRGNFPRRNRIISGLVKGVVVVEAAKKSGALITVDYALSQGKEVFAVPGRADSYVSRGVNGLIQNGAKLVTNVEDITEELNIGSDSIASRTDVEGAYIELSDEQIAVIRMMAEKVPVHLDRIQETVNIDNHLLPKVLLSLEMKKFIKTLPGSNYVLCSRYPLGSTGGYLKS